MNEPTNDNDIDALLRYLLTSGHTQHWNDDSARWRAALTALVAERDALREENIALRSRQKSHQDEVLDRVFEMDALRKRIAELESQPLAASDLRERLLESALQGSGCRLGIMEKSDAEELGRQTTWIVNGALDAMRKGEQNGK